MTMARNTRPAGDGKASLRCSCGRAPPNRHHGSAHVPPGSAADRPSGRCLRSVTDRGVLHTPPHYMYEPRDGPLFGGVGARGWGERGCVVPGTAHSPARQPRMSATAARPRRARVAARPRPPAVAPLPLSPAATTVRCGAAERRKGRGSAAGCRGPDVAHRWHCPPRWRRHVQWGRGEDPLPSHQPGGRLFSTTVPNPAHPSPPPPLYSPPSLRPSPSRARAAVEATTEAGQWRDEARVWTAGAV